MVLKHSLQNESQIVAHCFGDLTTADVRRHILAAKRLLVTIRPRLRTAMAQKWTTAKPEIQASRQVVKYRLLASGRIKFRQAGWQQQILKCKLLAAGLGKSKELG